MDLIEREDAIKVTWQEPSYTDAINALTEVRERIKDIPSAEEWKDECDRAYSTGWIRGMESAEKQGEWIPCSEGLPSENGTYIVTEKRFAIDDRNHQGKYQTLVEEVDFRDGRWNRAKFFEVVAWQQRPEPWEGA